MNKYQKAYEILLEVWQGVKTEEEGFPDYDDINEALYEIGELVNKETPMKPKDIKNKNRKGTEWVCPNCNHHIAYFDELGIGTVRVFNYCIECGQKLNLRSDSE